VSEQNPPISTSGAQRRTTRIAHTIPLRVTWVDGKARTVAEETATISINCHGFRYLSKQRPQIHTKVTIKLVVKKEGNAGDPPAYTGRVAFVRKSQRLDGLYLVGVELEIPSNIWNVDEAPEDWAAFSPRAEENPVSFLAEVDRMLQSTRTETFYQLLNVERDAPRSEVKRNFYQLAGRFHPDHHMEHPEWTPRLLTLMEGLTTAYKTLSDDRTKKEYDLLLARGAAGNGSSDSRGLAQGYLQKAQECMAEKNIAGSILWLHRAIESEPGSSSHRAMLGRCLSAVPEYRREAIEQFEMAIELDSRNVAAHLGYGELLEILKAPWRARSHYMRVLELDANHREARERLNRLGVGAPRASSKRSLLGRLTRRR